MPQPAALMARMNANIAASRPHSRPGSPARILCTRDAETAPAMDRTALQPRTRVRRPAGPGDRTHPRGASPLRDSAGFSPDFAGQAATPGRPGAMSTVSVLAAGSRSIRRGRRVDRSVGDIEVNGAVRPQLPELVLAVDVADGAGPGPHDERVRGRPARPEPDAGHQLPVGDPGGRE